MQEELDRDNDDPSPQLSEEEVRRQLEQDLDEIKNLGLVQRAFDEFAARIPRATVQQARIGYFVTKDVVWCDFRYTFEADSKEQQKEFGFRKKTENEWELMWQAEQKHDD